MQVSSSGAAANTQGFQQLRYEMFSKLDSDASGALSLDEFSAIGQNLPGGKNDSSKIQSRFSELDTDGSGDLSAAELEVGKPPVPPDMAQSLLALQESDPFSEADADASGDLSLEEFTKLGELTGHGEETEEQVSALFNSLDTDGNGVITQAELEAGRPESGQTAQAAAATTGNSYSAMQFEAMIEKYLQSMFSSYGQNGLNSSTSLAA